MQVIKIADENDNQIKATNPLDVAVQSLAAPSTLPLPTGAATSAAQTTGNASLASIDYKAYKGKDRTTTTGAAEELTIPASSKTVLLTCAPNSDGYVELNADATTGSPIYMNELTPIKLDLGSVTKLSVWVVAGNMGAVFYG